MREHKRMSYEKKKKVAGFIFVSFWLLGFITLFLRPLIMALMFSLSKLTIGDGISYKFIGFGNYNTALFQDATFTKHLAASLTSMFTQVPMIVIFSLFIATMLNRNIRGRVLYRAVFFLPVIIASGVIIGIIKSDPLSQQAIGGGAVSNLLQGASFQQLLLDVGISQQIVTSIMGVINNIFELVWKSGIQIILCISGLQTVSTALYEAAQIEGASGWEIFWKITFPMMSPILIVCVVYTVIDSFTDYSNPLMKFINDTAQRLNFEYSAAMTWIYFIIIAVIVGIVYALVNKHVFYLSEVDA